MWAQRPFLHGYKNKYKKLSKINTFDVHAKFALRWQPLVGVNTLKWASQHNNKNMTTFHFGFDFYFILYFLTF